MVIGCMNIFKRMSRTLTEVGPTLRKDAVQGRSSAGVSLYLKVGGMQNAARRQIVPDTIPDTWIQYYGTGITT